MHEALARITFQQLEIFFCTVEQESFTRAAHVLHMTQSAVSKSIAKLEQELDLALFTRHYRELRVTEAGRELYNCWKEKLDQISADYEEIYHVQHAQDMRLKVGVANTTDLNTYYWPIVNRFLETYPECSLEPVSDNMWNLISRLQDGFLDMIFVPDFLMSRIEELGLLWKWAARGQAQVLLPKGHPLLEHQGELTLELLQDEQFPMLDESSYPDLQRSMEELFSAKGYSLNISEKQFHTLDSARDFFRPADGILIVDAFFQYSPNTADMVRRPLHGVQNGILCCWKETNSSRYLRNLLKQLPFEP